MATAQWAKTRGARVHANLDLEAFIDESIGLRGVVALNGIDEGELLLAVPASLAIGPSLQLARHSSTMSEKVRALKVAFCAGGLEDASPFIQTVLALLHEQSLGQKSEWATYIEYLSRVSIDPPACWKAREKVGLYNNTLSRAGHRYFEAIEIEEQEPKNAASVAEIFNDKILPVLECAPTLWSKNVCTAAAFERACFIVRSRGFHSTFNSGTIGPFLIPLIDQLNHSSWKHVQSTELKAVVEKSEGQAALSGLIFSMHANRMIEAGEQIMHSYGAFSDIELLDSYGFVEGFSVVKKAPLHPLAGWVHSLGGVPRIDGMRQDIRTIVATCNPNNRVALESPMCLTGIQFSSFALDNATFDERYSAITTLGLINAEPFYIRIEGSGIGMISICSRLLTGLHLLMFEEEEFNQYFEECGGEFGDGEPILFDKVMRGDDVPAEFTLRILTCLFYIVNVHMLQYGKSGGPDRLGMEFSKRFAASLSRLANAQQIDDESSKRRASVHKVRLVEMSILMLLRAQLLDQIKELAELSQIIFSEDYESEQADKKKQKT